MFFRTEGLTYKTIIKKKGMETMGLINCPKCRETISDKAVSCPHCSFVLSEQNQIGCKECGKGYDSDLTACPNCGCPKPMDDQKYGRRKRKIIITAIILIALLVISSIGFLIYKKHQEEEYSKNMQTISYTMIEGAQDARMSAGLIENVWRNAIYQERNTETDEFTMENGKFVDDFDSALSNLFEDKKFIKKLSKIEEDQEYVIDLMKKLKNPPKKYKEAYSVLKIYYDNYIKITNMALDPTGNLETFSEDLLDYETEIKNFYGKIKLYLD